GEDENVDLWVPEDPEEVHPDDSGTARLRVEKMSAQITIDEQHDLRGRQWTDHQDDHPRHDEIQPDEKGHPSERHPWTPHAHDRGNDVHHRAYAAEPGHEQAEHTVIGAVTWRECPRRQRRIREPSDVRSV